MDGLRVLPTSFEPAKHCLHTCDKGLRAEGLRDIVVGSEFKADDRIRFFGLGGKHDDRHHGGVRSGSEPLTNFQAVDLGQHQVQHDEIRLVLFRAFQPFGSGSGRQGAESFFVQVELDEVQNVLFVFDDEDLLAGLLRHGMQEQPTGQGLGCQAGGKDDGHGTEESCDRHADPYLLTTTRPLTYGAHKIGGAVPPGELAIMKIYLANPRGFCAGVDRAIDIVDLSLKKYGAPIYVRHEIVHSRHVVNSLRQKGAVFVEELSEVPEGSVVIFSAHGVAKSVWEEANRRRLHVIDATCPLVIKVHNEVNRDYTQGYDLILIGHAGHPEVIGTLGQIPDKFHLVSSVHDVEKLQVESAHSLSYVTQTTLSVDECRDIVEALHRRFPNIKGPHQEDICYATQNRQNAVKELSKLVDVILVIGSPNSSNSNRLRELGEQCGIPSYLIDSASDINPVWLDGVKAVGITAGASAPEVLVAEVVAYLKGYGTAEVEDLTVIEEDVEFLLPKELIHIESSKKTVGIQSR